MQNKVNYEWDVEEVEPDGDTFEHHHRGEGELHLLLKEYGRNVLTGTGSTRLVLVRDEGNDIGGIVDRSWAYVKDGKLPIYTSDPVEGDRFKIPQRLHAEFARALKGLI